MTAFFDGGTIRRLMDDLEEMAESGRAEPERVRQWGNPAEIAFLIRMKMLGMLRLGPVRSGAGPSGLLRLAQSLAQTGLLGFGDLAELRAMLDRIFRLLVEAEAWSPESPPWWAPLPEPLPGETLWADCSATLALPDLASAETRADRAGFHYWPGFLPSGTIEPIHRELTAHAESLGLERAGVGAGGTVTHHRSDEVRYFSGVELELLSGCPHLAVLIQWGRRFLAQWLPSLVPGGRLIAPRTAMLSRYSRGSGGYAAHVDNPGGDRDNGRALSLILYLNDRRHPCLGGELAIWRRGALPGSKPELNVPAGEGGAVLLDSRKVVHQVRPLGSGAERWALTFWFNDKLSRTEEAERPLPALPDPGLSELLLPIDAPPLPAKRALCHHLDGPGAGGSFAVCKIEGPRPRVGLVSTVYRAGRGLDAWLRHHFGLGFDHIVLVFDHLEEEEERRTADRVKRQFSGSALTLWSGELLMAEGWPGVPRTDAITELLPFVRSGSTASAVASRQTLNASAALVKAKTKAFGGRALDWLVHLDADECFYLAGSGRGGASLHDHFSALDDSGIHLARYANHELLVPFQHGDRPRFKLNPRLASARLGPGGWASMTAQLAMSQKDERPYFLGYHNGKSAVRVERGQVAAGVHSWSLSGARAPGTVWFLAGPGVLHFHCVTGEVFRRKCLARSTFSTSMQPELFPPGKVESEAFQLIARLRREGTDQREIERRIGAFYRRATSFSPAEISLLEEAGLILTPELPEIPLE